MPTNIFFPCSLTIANIFNLFTKFKRWFAQNESVQNGFIFLYGYDDDASCDESITDRARTSADGSEHERRPVRGLFTSQNEQLESDDARVGTHSEILRDEKWRLFQLDARP